MRWLALLVFLAAPAYAACPSGTSPIEPAADGSLGICVEQAEGLLVDCEVREEQTQTTETVLQVTPGTVRRWTPSAVDINATGYLTARCQVPGGEWGERSAPAVVYFRRSLPGTPVLTP